MADGTTARLTDEHAAFLSKQAIDIDLATSLGVRSLITHDDNPQEDVWPNFSNHPAILFPWTSPDGRVEYQVRPDNPTGADVGKKVRKYIWARGMKPVLWAVRTVAEPRHVLIVEGTKQCLAAASYAPADVSVYGIAGVRLWQQDGQPIADLAVAEGQSVIVIFDADAATNPEVYKAGMDLARALTMEGAVKVEFSRMTGGEKAGLDDVLGARPPQKRAAFMDRLITGAKSKPADKQPTGKKNGGKGGGQQEGPDDLGRVLIVVNDDRMTVINDLTKALLDRWNASELFNHGGVISWRQGDAMRPVDKGSFTDLVAATARTMIKSETATGTTYTWAWPDTNVMAATVSRASAFAPLDRIAHAPFVRPDGSIVTEAGYDEATRTMLIPDQVFEGMTLPDAPSQAEIERACRFLMEDWLGDFPLMDDTAKANTLALLVTPAIRGMVPRVPLAVVDGLQMGVGKNLLADQILTVYTGRAAEPMNWVADAEELRKQITAAFRTGAEFFVFDEAHTIDGAPLAQALTASTWQDRILGVSTMANFPNTITWISLGNQVQVKGDLTRRVYQIPLRPSYANPQDRAASSFRHPGVSGLDLGSWTRANRRELLRSILLLVRAWFAQGQPASKRTVSFGSFEVWERIVGGIVQVAGLTGFLDNLKVWRSESDFDTQYWAGHLDWLRRTFGSDPFKTAEVKAAALADPAAYLAPPRLDDTTEKSYGKHLGEAYSRIRGRRYGALWLDRVGGAHGHVSVWQVFDGEAEDDGFGPVDPEPGPADPNEHADGAPCSDPWCSDKDVDPNEHEEARGPAPEDTDGEGHEEVRPPVDTETSVVPAAMIRTFDLETGDAGDLYRTPGEEYVRIGATAGDDQPVVAYAEKAALQVGRDIRLSRVATGHNIMAFDLPALVRAGVMDFPEIHSMAAAGRFADGLLMARYLDPPMARDSGFNAQHKYDLGTLGQRYELGEKLKDISAELAKKYGGWANIPIDDSEDGQLFRQYMVQDVELSRSLYKTLAELLDKAGPAAQDYLVREHRVAAIAAQIQANGFLMDVPELERRVAEIDHMKSRVLGWLNKRYGVPLKGKDNRTVKSPLATNAGQAALEKAFRAAGVTHLWYTENSGKLDVSGDHMRHIAMENHHLPEARKLAKAVSMIVGARSVYQTALNYLMPDGRVHSRIGFDQATGRWSVKEPGLTVFGKRGGRHVERNVFLPDPGEVIISADLSQVDMRAIAGLSQDQAYISMLDSDDPHAEIAQALFGDPKMREVAKPIGHGWNYGRGLKAISEGNDIPPALVVQFDQSMRERFPRLVEWREEIRAEAEAGGLLDNGFGRKMKPDPRRAHTQGPALMGQGCARDIMMEGLLRLPMELMPMLRGVVHDEVLLSVPEDSVPEVSRMVVDALSLGGERWKGVRIDADVSKPGKRWGDCYGSK